MHDQHFLERLDRLDDPEVDEALALYYDAALVRDLLSYVAERGHGDRVAIALDDGGEGPFIIVTQRGDFVTALGRGMGVGALPVVPRAAWIAIRNKNSRHAEAWARADKLARGRVANLARAFADGGSHVSQEVMLGMHAITPMFSGALIAGYARDIRTLIDALNSIGRRDRWRQMDTAFFDTMGRVAWRAANALVLLAASHLKKRGAEDPFLALLMKHRPTGFLGELGVFGPFARRRRLTAWSTRRRGSWP